ncbi:hypothetical protein EZV62_022461 [Acer yangbiense]|uniref:Uncharacterized protein n=1 Tax=Acer yangbiense TaxID=1000413 RepID=A0A5C7H9N3_9ROSI|nr:hypothetical protein EZV62_022461 [Acer yangbiense]
MTTASTSSNAVPTSSTAPTSSTVPPFPTSTSPAQFPPIQVHHLISVKLDSNNYLLWLTQFKPLLKGYDLQGYVDGSFPCPTHFLPDSTLNHAYVTWQKQDQILLGWLLSSLSESVLAYVVGLSSSREVWEAIEKHFSSRSQSRIIFLKQEL